MADKNPAENNQQTNTQTNESQANPAATLEKLQAILNGPEGIETKIESLNALMSDVEAHKNNLKTALNNIDAINAFVKEISVIRNESSSNGQAIKTESEAINELKEKVDKLYKDAAVAANELEIEHKDLKAALGTLKTKKDELGSILDDLTKIKESAITDKEKVQVDLQTITQTKTEFESLKNQAQSTYDSLVARQSEVSGKITEITGFYEKTKEQFTELFEGKKNDDGSIAQIAINDQVRTLFSELKTKLEETQNINQKANDDFGLLRKNTETEFSTLKGTLKEQFDGLLAEERQRLTSSSDEASQQLEQLKKALQTEIHSLLPDAGAAGLASAYFEAKSKYSPTKFAAKTDAKIKWWQPLLHFIGGSAAPAFFYIMLLAPLIYLTSYMIGLFNYLKTHPGDFTTNYLLLRAAISLPLVAISYFGWNSISLYRGMYEEYNHKQRVLQLYHSFKEEVGAHGGEEEKQRLLAIMLATVADKPKLAMHRGDKGMGEFFKSMIPAGGVATAVEQIKDVFRKPSE